MFQLGKILEHWATIYKPMRHDPSASARPEDKAFFLIDRFALENEWTRIFNLLRKPCLCYTTTIEAEVAGNNPNAITYHYGFYLLTKQRQSNNYEQDDEGAAYAKYDLNEMVLHLLAWLFEQRRLAERNPDLPKDERNGWRGLQLEQMSWWSTPRQKNGWWVLGVDLTGLDPRPLCINPEDYIDNPQPLYPATAATQSTPASTPDQDTGQDSDQAPSQP